MGIKKTIKATNRGILLESIKPLLQRVSQVSKSLKNTRLKAKGASQATRQYIKSKTRAYVDSEISMSNGQISSIWDWGARLIRKYKL